MVLIAVMATHDIKALNLIFFFKYDAKLIKMANFVAK